MYGDKHISCIVGEVKYIIVVRKVKMESLKNYESILNVINNNKLVLIYAKSYNCAVCDVLLPKVEERVNRNQVLGALVVIDDVPEFSGQYTVYSVPTVLIFFSGKEVFRQSGFIQVNDIEKELAKWKMHGV